MPEIPLHRFRPALLACLAATSTALAQCEAGNLISNCGFEVDTAGWTTTWVDSLVRTTSAAHGGIASAETDARFSATSNLFLSQITTCVPVNPETNYGVQTFFKLVSGAIPSCSVGTVFIDALKCAGFLVGNQSTLPAAIDDQSWTRASGIAASPADALSVAVILTCQASLDFLVRQDDAFLAPAIFLDGFESSDLSEWSSSSP